MLYPNEEEIVTVINCIDQCSTMCFSTLDEYCYVNIYTDIRQSKIKWTLKNRIVSAWKMLIGKPHHVSELVFTKNEVGHIFEYFVKKGVNYWFKDDPIKHWTTMLEGHDRGWESFLIRTVKPDRIKNEQ